MLLGGGSSCQSCGCAPGCSECRHYIVDTWYETRAANLTINGASLAARNDFFGTPVSIDVALSGAVQSTCFFISDSPKVLRVRAFFLLDEAVTVDINGCFTTEVSIRIEASLHASSYENNFRTTATYLIGLNCTDTGGTATQSSLWEFVEGSVPEDCMIEAMEFLDSLDIVTTVSWDACECPP
jgi:hypothetical protein